MEKQAKEEKNEQLQLEDPLSGDDEKSNGEHAQEEDNELVNFHNQLILL